MENDTEYSPAGPPGIDTEIRQQRMLWKLQSTNEVKYIKQKIYMTPILQITIQAL